jgi:hypothetical protein
MINSIHDHNQSKKQGYINFNFLFILRYEMHYKQRITTEDIFLQMGNKNSSSASCEDLVVNFILIKY